MSSSFEPRPVCYRCLKPQVTCICAGLSRVDNRTEVLVLQHPREHLHPIGTARFARLGLENVRVEIAWDAGVREDEPPAWLPPGAALLYPGEHARDLREIASDERPSALLVLDGTWHTARTLYRDKRWLHALPHYRFLPAAPGRYRLRREPQDDYVSTIEAIVEALYILEPGIEGLPQLLAAFDRMIDRQLEYIGTGGGKARLRKRRRPAAERRLPHAFVEGFERLIVLYGESSRPRDGVPREFVYFTALSLTTGARFERVIMPASGMPDDEHLGHMGLTRDDFAAADGGESFPAEWAQFLAKCGPNPLFATWNHRTLQLLDRITGTPGTPSTRLSLKGIYRAVFGIDAHNLDDVVSLRGLVVPPGGWKGRAERRLGGAVAVARLLYARAVPENSRTSNIGQTAADEQPADRVPPQPPAAAGHVDE